MAEREFAPDQTLAVLLGRGVEFIVVGGIAADLPEAVAVERPDGTIRFASAKALIRMKRAANRPKDQNGIAALEALVGRSDEDE